MSTIDKAFTGSIPKIYESHLVPLIFTSYAEDIGKRLKQRSPQRVLEVAAGTGVVTRAMVAALPASTEIVATDLNPAMLEQAAAIGTSRPVEFKPADAMQLPFPDASFDAVVCQFGVMFFPDKPKAFGEFKRVLKPGGVLIFNVWDRLEKNEFADAVHAGLAAFFPEDPPRFLSRAPYAYFDHAKIAADVAAGGFTARPDFDTVAARSRAKLASDPAVGYCQGSPLRAEIEERGALEHATDAAAKEVEKRFGAGPVDALIQAHVVTVLR
ncbi:MAG TPA: methyltransferase domain-containing protein [Vicinamibacterales bacterium]|nr:methyltransferase domain-containing protein [Vicinamibacterales bacterium]